MIAKRTRLDGVAHCHSLDQEEALMAVSLSSTDTNELLGTETYDWTE